MAVFLFRSSRCEFTWPLGTRAGIALGTLKKVWIVGPRENIFCWHDRVAHFDTFEQALDAVAEQVELDSIPY